MKTNFDKISHRIYIPDPLKEKVLELLVQHAPAIKNFYKDKLFFLLSLITEVSARNMGKVIANNGFVNLSSTRLRSYVYDYKKYLDYLLKHNIIFSDNHYIVSEKSKGFMINPKYNGTVNSTFIYNPTLIRNLKRHQRNETKQDSSEYKHLRKWINGLQIDEAIAFEHIEKQYAYRNRHLNNRTWDFKNNRYKDPLEQYNSAKINIDAMRSNDFFFIVDEKIGRLHTNMSNIQSDLRNLFTYKGQKLVSVDISNSQPYLSTILFRPSFYELNDIAKAKEITFSQFPNVFSSTLTLSSIFKGSHDSTMFSNEYPCYSPSNSKFAVSCSTHYNSSVSYSSYSNYYSESINTLTDSVEQQPFHNSTSITDIKSSSTKVIQETPPIIMLQKPLQEHSFDDIRLFFDLVERGALYDYLTDAFTNELNTQLYDKKNVKAAIFQILYTDNRFIGQKAAARKRIFKKLFPNVYQLFAAYKKGDATRLPRLLQQIEVRLVLDIICERIVSEAPHVPLFTIHDSIATTIENLEYVQAVMVEELIGNIGFKPNLKIEYWEPGNLKKIN